MAAGGAAQAAESQWLNMPKQANEQRAVSRALQSHDLLTRGHRQRPVPHCLPSDSATITAKYRTAPLTSLNQEQLKRNRMEEEVTFDLSLTRTLLGGTGGPFVK